MHLSKAFLFSTFLVVPTQTVLAGPSIVMHTSSADEEIDRMSGKPRVEDIKRSEVQVYDGDLLSMRQDLAHSGIGVEFYSDDNCASSLTTIDDMVLGRTYILDDLPASSFQLLYRGLQGQEQFDISRKITGNACGQFIASYYSDTPIVCLQQEEIDCFVVWDNHGL